MINTDRDKKTCDKYSSLDENNKVHCNECPLNHGGMMCKAVGHYDRHTRVWVLDDD